MAPELTALLREFAGWKAISIMQPWTCLVVYDLKDIENRDWRATNPGLRFRGEVLIHAGLRKDRSAWEDVQNNRHPVTGEPFDFSHLQDFHFGGIVGQAEIVDCVTQSDSKWFVGPYGFVIRNAKPLPFMPCRGQLGFFTPELAAA